MIETASAKENNFYQIFFSFLMIGAAWLLFPYFFAERMWSDEALYGWSAKRIFAHPELTFSAEVSQPHPPLFPAILAVAHFFLPPFEACRFVMLIFYLAGITATYYLGQMMAGRFVGLVSAIFLAFNYFYYTYSTMILIDCAAVFFVTLLAIFLWNVSESSSWRHHLLIGLLTGVILFLKMVYFYTIIFILIFYLAGIEKTSLKDRLKLFLIPFSVYISSFLFLCLKNIHQLGAVFYQQSVSVGNYQNPFLVIKMIWDLWRQMLPPVSDSLAFFSLAFLLILFFLIGFFSLMRDRKYREATFLLAWIFAIALSLQSLTIEVEIRYALTILPPFLIITALGIEALLKWYNRNIAYKIKFSPSLIVTGLFVLALLIFIETRDKFENVNREFTGYAEGGEVVKKFASPDAFILAGSERQVRYFSDINYKEFGGQIIAFRQDKEEFEEITQKHPGPVILVIDAWEMLQPQWSRISDQTLKYLVSQGFQLKHVVFRMNGRGRRAKLSPVIWIFLKNEPDQVRSSL